MFVLRRCAGVFVARLEQSSSYCASTSIFWWRQTDRSYLLWRYWPRWAFCLLWIGWWWRTGKTTPRRSGC